MRYAVYQRGWVINSQLNGIKSMADASISKGMGDQFSAEEKKPTHGPQYIKGDG